MRTVVLLTGICIMMTLVSANFALAINPTGYGQAGGEFDIRVKRVPRSELAAAKKMKPPFEATPEILAEGKKIFLGPGGCISCHGPEGKGDGGAASNLPIQPRDFTNPKFKKYRSLGELMWVLKNGSMGQSGKVPGTGMLPVVQPKGFISETDGWKVLLYERSLGEKK
ncbi:MAG: c-type cytochrome [Nitrospirales bacterium]